MNQGTTEVRGAGRGAVAKISVDANEMNRSGENLASTE